MLPAHFPSETDAPLKVRRASLGYLDAFNHCLTISVSPFFFAVCSSQLCLTSATTIVSRGCLSCPRSQPQYSFFFLTLVFWGVSPQYMWLHAGATRAQRRPLNAPQSGPRVHLQGTTFPLSSLRPVVLISLSQSACGLSVMPDYHAFAKYNLHSTAARRSTSTTIPTN